MGRKGLSIFAVVAAVGLFVSFGVAHAAVPTAPTNLTGVAAGSGRINLTWQDNSANETKFVIHRSYFSDFWNPLVVEKPEGATTHADTTNVKVGHTYYYKVFACNGDGCAASSATTTKATGATAALRNFSIKYDSSCQISLRWTYDGLPITGFQVRRGTNSALSPATSITNVPTYNPANPAFYSMIDSGLVIGQVYYYEVRLIGKGGWVTPWPSGTTTPIMVVPPAIQTFTGYADNYAAAGNVERGNLDWTIPYQPTSGGGFEVMRFESDNGTNFVSSTPPTVEVPYDRKFYKETGLSAAKLYKYSVRSFEGGGVGCPAEVRVYSSAPAQAKTLVIPTRPTNMTVSYSYEVVRTPQSQMNLTWDGVVGANRMEVWRKAATSTYQKVVELPGNATAYTDPPDGAMGGLLTPNETYSYKVRACTTAGGCSAYSDEKTLPAASAPQKFEARILYTAGGSREGKVLLSWTNTMPDRNYVLERRSESGDSDRVDFPEEAYGAEVETITMYDEGVPMNDKYTYRVRTRYGEDNFSDYSDPATVDLSIIKLLEGAAWAEVGGGRGIGWVNFNSDNDPTPGHEDYSVQVDRSGLFSGLAWASSEEDHGYGWLSFNEADLKGCPHAPCKAWLDTDGTTVRGWAKFTGAAGGSWTGWVSLHDWAGEPVTRGALSSRLASRAKFSLVNLLASNESGDVFEYLGNVVNGAITALAQTASAPYGLSYDAAEKVIRGEAWGGDIAGWIGFTKPECVKNGVNLCKIGVQVLNREAGVSNVRVETPSVDPGVGGGAWCDAVPRYTVKWDFLDPDGDAQERAEVKFVGGGSSVTTSTGPGEGSYPQLSLKDPLSVLVPNTSYQVQVRVHDGVMWSDWSALSASITTPTHYGPLVEFSWVPENVMSGIVVTFTDESQNRSPESGPYHFEITEREWTFEKSMTMHSTDLSPSVIFQSLTEPADVTLKITDSDNKMCSYTKEVSRTGEQTPPKRRIFRER